MLRTAPKSKVAGDVLQWVLDMVRQNPALLDKIKDCVVVGGYGVARLAVRKLD